MQKECLFQTLVKSTQDNNQAAIAFRIVWRDNEENVWQNIQTHRMMYDTIIQNMPGVLYFVSAVTGVLTKYGPKPIRTKVYPALAYWAVLENEFYNGYEMMKSLQGAAMERVEAKLLNEPPVMKVAEKQHNTLCIVLKDHGEGYVQGRMMASFPAVGDQGAGQAGRLVIVNDRYSQLVRQTQNQLKQAGITLDLVHRI